MYRKENAVWLASLLLSLVLLALRTRSQVEAAVYWADVQSELLGLGYQNNPITVCFVGDAVTLHPDRVREIVTHLQEFAYAANIDFETEDGLPLLAASQNNIDSLNCPAPTTEPNGWDFHRGDIRVQVYGSSEPWEAPTPGEGCFNDAMEGAPDAVRSAPGKFDVFWRGTNDVLRHRSWTLVSSNKWDKSEMEELGGPLTSSPSVASWATDKLVVFARGQDGALWYRRRDGNIWSSWDSLGGQLIGSPDAVSSTSNRIDVFVRWSDNTLRQISSDDGGLNWNDWDNRGGVLTSAPGVTAWSNSGLIVFVRGQDGGLWYRRYDGTSWGVWTGKGGNLAGAPDATAYGSGNIDVVVRWTDNTLHQLTSTNAGLTFGSWVDHGGILNSDPSIVADATAYKHIYYQGTNTSLFQRIWKWDSDNSTFIWTDAMDQGVNTGEGSYSGGPWNVIEPNRRACRYNMRLFESSPDGGGPAYLNHTLHEFGHALGLSHEHGRTDATCPAAVGTTAAGFITPYDRDSVMHYRYKTCDINGNFDYTGLSALDRLALHIIYPQNNRRAEIVGTLVIPAGDTLQLWSSWEVRGGNMPYLIDPNDFRWSLDGNLTTGYTLSQTMNTPGDYLLQVTYIDFLGREYQATHTVHVLDESQYKNEILAPVAAKSALMFVDQTSVFLPAVLASQ